MQQEETRQAKRIQQISVTGLFGMFDHTVPLQMRDRITIIHGPNGFGKTMLLKLLNALFSEFNTLLLNVPFDEFKVDFDDNTSFWVNKTSQEQALTEEMHSGDREIVFHATGRKPFSFRSKSLQTAKTPIPLSMIERFLPQLDRIASGAWRNISTGEILSLEDILERYHDRLPEEFFEERTRISEWLIEIRKSVNIHFIETQRLLAFAKLSKRSEYERATASEYAVKEDSKHLVEVIGRKLKESGALSQSLDSTYPARLFSPTSHKLQITEDELLAMLEKLEKKRSRLMEIGLLDQETRASFPLGYNQGIEPDKQAALAIYAEDTEQKLGIFDELARKMELLTTIINNRFLYKTLFLNKEQGFVFTTGNGAILPLEDLSTGEQHELVLFYELLFRVTPGSLILIDEPEISLHVVWQEQFLKDVQQITQLADIDVILATHSPDIISDRRDLVVELEGPEHGRLSRVPA